MPYKRKESEQKKNDRSLICILYVYRGFFLSSLCIDPIHDCIRPTSNVPAFLSSWTVPLSFSSFVYLPVKRIVILFSFNTYIQAHIHIIDDEVKETSFFKDEYFYGLLLLLSILLSSINIPFLSS